MIYFDNAATTPLIPGLNSLDDSCFGNSSSIYKLGVKTSIEIEKVRNLILTELNSNQHKVYFTGTGTEANNWVIFSTLYLNRNNLRKKILTSKIEHPSILNPLSFYSTMFGFEIEYVENDKNGIISLSDLKKKLNSDILFCSIMHVNNELGTCQPIDEIQKLCHTNQVIFHVDACQGFLKKLLDLKRSNIDFVTINSHKINGPKGVGALVVHSQQKMAPFILGGGQEFGLRSGTLNNSGILGFGRAIAYWKEQKTLNKLENLSKYFTELIKEKLPEIQFNAEVLKESLFVFSMRIPNKNAKDILRKLEKKEIYISTGSACSSNKDTPSYVLKAIGLSDQECTETIRVSLGILNEIEEIEVFVSILKEIIYESI